MLHICIFTMLTHMRVEAQQRARGFPDHRGALGVGGVHPVEGARVHAAGIYERKGEDGTLESTLTTCPCSQSRNSTSYTATTSTCANTCTTNRANASGGAPTSHRKWWRSRVHPATRTWGMPRKDTTRPQPPLQGAPPQTAWGRRPGGGAQRPADGRQQQQAATPMWTTWRP